MEHAHLSRLLAFFTLAPALGAGSAQAQCTVTTVFAEDFRGGVLPPGWSAGGQWGVVPSAPCPSACMQGFFAYYGLPTKCNCRQSTSILCVPGELVSPGIALPPVAPGETLVLDFCFGGFHDGLCSSSTATCTRLLVEHPGGRQELILGGHAFSPCDGQGTLPPYDLTAFAGQAVRLRWDPGCIDPEGTLFLEVDDVRIRHYAGSGGDCNGNLVPDDCDLALGTSQDCNANLIPDECDIASGLEQDCNQNGVPDSCDIAAGTEPDCDENGVPDPCDLASGAVPDCNQNGVPDSCDIASGTSNDFDGDGVPDECQCSYQTYCLTSPNSVGPGALISLSGSTSKTLNDTTLLVTAAPPGQIGIFYYGGLKTQVPFGEGWRCVAGQVARLLPSVPLGPSGSGAYFLDLLGPPPAGAILAGETWNFQFWYRDPIPVGVGFNLSDALEITFCP